VSLPLKRKWLWLAALVLLLTIPLAFLLSRVLGGFLRDVVAVPILYLVWIGRLYLSIVPPVFFWGGFLLFGLVLAVTSVLVGSGGPDGDGEGSQQGAQMDHVYTGQVEQLASHIHFANRSTYFRRRLAQRLGRLMLRSLGYGERYRPAQIERGLDVLDAPPETRAFLSEGKQLILSSRPAGLIAWLKRLLRGREKTTAFGLDLEHTVRFLEERLEGL
jgi:hypothetical protein